MWLAILALALFAILAFAMTYIVRALEQFRLQRTVLRRLQILERAGW
jgi:hypothetical protein